MYAIPLGAGTVLRIRTSLGCGGERQSSSEEEEEKEGGIEEPEVTTWKLPFPNDVLQKWEGGVMASNGCMYCMPNNHKAVLQIVPNCVPSRESLHLARDLRERERESRREMEEMERMREMERRKDERERKRERRLRDKKEREREVMEGGMVPSEEGATSGSSCPRVHEKAKDATDTLVSTNHNAAEVSSSEGEAIESSVMGEEMMWNGTTTPTDQSIVSEDFVPPDDDAPYKYKSGIPTLRSSAHRVKFSLDHRKHDPNPKGSDGNATNTTFLPAHLCDDDVLAYSTSAYDFHDAVVGILQRCDGNFVGVFRSSSDGTSVTPKLEDFVVPPNSLIRECQRGKLERAQEYLSDAVASDADFLRLFDDFVAVLILPRLKARLQSSGAHDEDTPITFFYQRPPTLRLQPGPARALVRAHNDAEYGREFDSPCFYFRVILAMN